MIFRHLWLLNYRYVQAQVLPVFQITPLFFLYAGTPSLKYLDLNTMANILQTAFSNHYNKCLDYFVVVWFKIHYALFKSVQCRKKLGFDNGVSLIFIGCQYLWLKLQSKIRIRCCKCRICFIILIMKPNMYVKYIIAFTYEKISSFVSTQFVQNKQHSKTIAMGNLLEEATPMNIYHVCFRIQKLFSYSETECCFAHSDSQVKMNFFQN